MRLSWVWLVALLLLVAAACGTASGRYDGEDIDGDDDDDNGAVDDDDNVDDDDDDSTVEPEVDNYTWIDADGNEVELYDYLGQVVLLNTAAFWCEPCREETPSLKDDLYEKYKDQGFTIIQLIVEDAGGMPATPDVAAAWRDEFGLSYPVCADPDWTLREDYFIEDVLPFNMLLSRDFQIELRTHEYDKDILSLMIEELL